MAPEVILCSPYDQTADIYSFGMVLRAMATFDSGGLQACWSQCPQKQFDMKIVAFGGGCPIPESVELIGDGWLKAIISSCINTKTISAAELVYGSKANAPTSFTWKNVFLGTSKYKGGTLRCICLAEPNCPAYSRKPDAEEEVAKIKIKERKHEGKGPAKATAAQKWEEKIICI